MKELKLEGHVFQFVEKELFNYRDNKAFLKSYEAEAQDILGINSALSNQNTPVMTGVSDLTSAKGIRLAAMAQKADRAKWFVRAIEDVLERLAEADRHLVELKYFSEIYTNIGVAQQLNISEREFYNRRRDIVERFARRMGLA